MNEQIKYADPWIPVGQYADNLVKELLGKALYGGARSYLGDAARSDKLTHPQLAKAAKGLERSEWAHKQVEARQIVNALKERDLSGKAWEKVGSDALTLLGRMIELGTEWALVEVLPYLDMDEIEWLAPLMDERKVLNRPKRHTMRCEIRRELKARQQDQ